MARQEIIRVGVIFNLQPILQNRQTRGAVSRRAGDVNPVAMLCPGALQSASRRHIAVNTQRHRQRSARGIAANELHIVIIKLHEQAVAKGLKPGFVRFRQGQGQG